MTISKQITLLIICIFTIYVNAQGSLLTDYVNTQESILTTINNTKLDTNVEYSNPDVFIEHGDSMYNFDNSVYNTYIRMYGIKRIILNNRNNEFINKDTLVVNNYVETGDKLFFDSSDMYGITNKGVIINNYGNININLNIVINNYKYIHINLQNVTTNYNFIKSNQGFVYNNTCNVTLNTFHIEHNVGNVSNNNGVIINNTGFYGPDVPIISAMYYIANNASSYLWIFTIVNTIWNLCTSLIGIITILFIVNQYYAIKFTKRA